MGKRRGQPIHGWIAIDKPEGLSSAAVVARVAKIGAGANFGHSNSDVGQVRVTEGLAFEHSGKGVATDTDDREGKTTTTSDVRPTREAILAALPRFVGEIAADSLKTPQAVRRKVPICPTVPSACARSRTRERI